MPVSYKKICVELLEAICTFSEEDSAKINAAFTTGTSCVYDKMTLKFTTPEGEHTIVNDGNQWEHTLVKVRSGSNITDVI